MMFDPELEDLRGHVRRVAISQTSRVFRDDGESVYRSVRAVTFGRGGQVTEHSSEYPSGGGSRTVCTYDSNGRLTETVNTGTNPDGSPWTLRRIYAYDDRGRLIEERHLRADGTVVGRRQPIHTADGRRIEEERFEPRGRGACGGMSTIGVNGLNMNFVCQRARSGRVVYDVLGLPMEITFTGRLGLTVGKVVFETDAAGRITALRAYGDTGSFGETVPSWLRPLAPVVLWVGRRMLNGQVRWNLARRGEWRTLTHTFLWGSLGFEILTRYDAHGRRVEERNRAVGGAWETIKTWKYDGDGRVVELREVDHTGELTDLHEYTYQVDARGNWVHRTRTAGRMPHSTEEVIETAERVIHYHD